MAFLCSNAERRVEHTIKVGTGRDLSVIVVRILEPVFQWKYLQEIWYNADGKGEALTSYHYRENTGIGWKGLGIGLLGFFSF